MTFWIILLNGLLDQNGFLGHFVEWLFLIIFVEWLMDHFVEWLFWSFCRKAFLFSTVSLSFFDDCATVFGVSVGVCWRLLRDHYQSHPKHLKQGRLAAFADAHPDDCQQSSGCAPPNASHLLFLLCLDRRHFADKHADKQIVRCWSGPFLTFVARELKEMDVCCALRAAVVSPNQKATRVSSATPWKL